MKSRIKNKRVLIATSAGINSAAVLVDTIRMINEGEKPKELHLLYVHINQHSTDSEPFVDALVAYAKHHFPETIYVRYHYDVLDFFKQVKMIPHPTSNVCTKNIKSDNIAAYKAEHGIEVDLIGFVKQEQGRMRAIASNVTGVKKGRVNIKSVINNGISNGLFEEIFFPTANWTDEDCFTHVKNAIGWYPSIYDILWTDARILPFLESVKGVMPERDRQIALTYATRGFGYDKSKRVFNHNNCLPCKNMQVWQFWLVKLFFPKMFNEAVALSKELGKYYGRSESDYEAIKIYTTFGREDFEVDFKEQSCGICAFG